jgi:choline transport protein
MSPPLKQTLTNLGWLTVSAWIINCAGLSSTIATVIAGLVELHYGSPPEATHVGGIMISVIVIPTLFNLFFRQLLPSLEVLGGVIHIVSLIPTIVLLIVRGQRSSADFVFKTIINDQSGWTNPGVCFGIGILPVIFGMTGA